MREILFKAKAINRDDGYHRTKYKNGDWVYGLITRLFDDRFQNLPAEMTDLNGVSGIEIDHNTICQCAGLTDKNGNKIWENDVVKDNVIFGTVVWDEKNARFMIDDINDELQDYSDWWHEVEVIGNIFDNPELLEGGGVAGQRQSVRDKASRHIRCSDCQYLHENGNCLKVGGFYSSIDNKSCPMEAGGKNG